MIFKYLFINRFAIILGIILLCCVNSLKPICKGFVSTTEKPWGWNYIVKKTTLGFKSKGDFHLLFDFNRNSTRWDIAVIFVPIAVFFLFGKHWGFCYFFDIEMDPNYFQHLLVTAASSTIHPFIGYLFSSNSVEVSRLFDNFVFHFNEIYSNCFQAWTERVASISSKWKIYRC